MSRFSPSPRLRVVVSLWGPVLAMCGLIFFLSSIPNLRITREWWDLLLRKAAHMAEYGILALLLVRAYKNSTGWSDTRILMSAFGFAVLYACTDEYHQGFVPGRGPSALDVAIDAAGAWFALRGWLVLGKK